jgi:hypothetical protein
VRKIALYIAAWLAAGAGAVTLATGGVSMVGNQVTGSRPAPLSADDVRIELEGGGDPDHRAAEPATTIAVAPTTTVAPTDVTTPDGQAPTTTSVPPAPSSGPAPRTNLPGATTTTTVVATPGAGATTTTTTTPPSNVQTRTYNLIGGTATLRFSPDGVNVVVASPNSGFSVQVEPSHEGAGVQVEFSSEGHQSQVEGWWDGGPVDEVEESDEGD